ARLGPAPAPASSRRALAGRRPGPGRPFGVGSGEDRGDTPWCGGPGPSRLVRMVAWVVEAWGQVEAWLLALVGSVWALPVLFATTAGDGFFPPIPGETVIVMLAVGAQSGGGVAWGLVLFVAALGAWCGDQLAYALGRALGTRALPALRGPRGPIGRASCR